MGCRQALNARWDCSAGALASLYNDRFNPLPPTLYPDRAASGIKPFREQNQ
jgi:hypothetical protein